MKTQSKPTRVQLPRDRRSSCSILGSLTALAAGLALFGGQPSANAQSDNFDSGALGSAWTKYEFFGQSYTFPTSGSGQALRIVANPVPGAAPAAAAIAQTNEYTDFYVALDLVDWDETKDQAVVLLGQWTPGGAAGLAEGTGMILNYDVLQDGENAGDRKGGQLQINAIFPGFAAATRAAANITFERGRSYRMVLQGVGTTYTGKVYDMNDLTTPLVTIVTEDSTYSSGLCGFLSFSRNGTTGTTDVTIDNYYAGATDPNVAPAPALAPPIAGTPIVVTRNPAKRFANFHPAASGISFTAQTFTAGQINASATKLFLNGADVSGALAPLPANGSTVNFTTAAGTLAANTLYSGSIVLEDTTGALKSTNTFWFDTFSDAFVASVKTIEAEDYNHSSGLYQLDPIPVSGLDTNGIPVNGGGIGYYDLVGTPEVDFFKPAGSYNFIFSEYRTSDRVQITQGSTIAAGRDEAGDIEDATVVTDPFRIHDTQRSKYVAANVWEYQVRLTSPGDWLNYTRSFAPTNYNVYLRCSSFGSTTVYLDQVTSDPTVTNQTTARLGTFNVPNQISRLNYRYLPLMDGSSPAVITLSDTNTLRLTIGGTVTKDERLIDLDYLVFIPTSPVLTIFDNFNDGNDTANPPWDHYDPLGGVTAAPASYTFPDGHYRILSPAPQAPDAGPARAGSFLRNAVYEDFYVSADLIDFDDTVRQAFGIAARINTPGLGTTGGYLFSWEPGSGTLPGETNGDLDISRLVGESPVGQIETEPSGLHLTKGKSYRFVFMGSGTNFEAQVYELPDTTNPLIRLPANDPDNLYPSGQVGLIVASQSSTDIPGDATWDNFLATTAEPRLSVSVTGGIATLSWPLIPFALQSTPSLSTPGWTTITSGITTVGNQHVYTTPATGTAFYRLIYP